MRRPRSPLSSAVAVSLALAMSLTLLAAGGLSVPAGATARTVRDSAPFFSETNKPIAVDGTFQPLVGDFGGSTQDDIIWYAPGIDTDLLWISNGDGSFTQTLLNPQVIAGGAIPIVGHFSNTSRDDVLWYTPGPGIDWLAENTGEGSFVTAPLRINGSYAPLLVPNPTGLDSVLWRSASGASSIWTFTGGTGHATHNVTTPVVGLPLVGDFSGSGHDDIFWYGSGSAPDSLWIGNGSGGFRSIPQHISGIYTPVVHDLTPGYDGRDDIFWDSPTGGASSLWQSEGNGTWSTLATTVPKGHPVAADGVYGVVYIVRVGFPDWVWYDNAPTAVSQPSHDTEIGTGYIPVVGNFIGNNDNIFWYKPGPAPEYLFYLNAIHH